eukprot:4966913-Heterocapsa_arctica.AAC.1
MAANSGTATRRMPQGALFSSLDESEAPAGTSAASMECAGRARPGRGWTADEAAEPSMVAVLMGSVSKKCAAGAAAPWAGGNSCLA